MCRIFRIVGGLAPTIVIFLLVVSESRGLPQLSFDDLGATGSPPGSLSYDGTNVLVGTGIHISSIEGPGPSLACAGCTIGFQSGAVLSENPPTGFLTNSIGDYSWDGGGVFQIKDGGDRPLFSGSFLNTVFGTATDLSPFGGRDITIVASGVDVATAHAEPILDHFGITGPNFEFVMTLIAQVPAGYHPNGSFSATVMSVDLVNMNVPVNAVNPEPTSLILSGLGLLALGLTSRNRRLQ